MKPEQLQGPRIALLMAEEDQAESALCEQPGMAAERCRQVVEAVQQLAFVVVVQFVAAMLQWGIVVAAVQGLVA